MSFRGYVSAKHRFHLQLPADLEEQVREAGRRSGLGLGAAIRVLLAKALQEGPQGQAASLAGLVAAEHAVLAVASILPDGERRMAELADKAMSAAEKRLALFTTGDER